MRDYETRVQVNEENVLRLARLMQELDVFEAQTGDILYDQTQIGVLLDGEKHECDAPGCMAGWAAVLASRRSCKTWSEWYAHSLHAHGAGREWLGLDMRLAKQLFKPRPAPKGRRVTPWEAASVLRNLAKTGEVDWNKARGLPPRERRRPAPPWSQAPATPDASYDDPTTLNLNHSPTPTT